MTSNPYFNPIQTSLKPSSTGFLISPHKSLFPNSPRIFPISRPAIHSYPVRRGSETETLTLTIPTLNVA